MTSIQTWEVAIKGMDCAECTQTVQRAISSLPGVEAADVFLTSEKAIIRLDPQQVDLGAINKAVSEAGYSVAQPAGAQAQASTAQVLPVGC